MKIIKNAFITIWASFMFIAIITLIVSKGAEQINIQYMLKEFTKNLDKTNLYKWILEGSIGEMKYATLNTFEKNFYLTSKVLSLTETIQGLSNIPIFGVLIKPLVEFLIFLASGITILIDLLFVVTNFVLAFILTTFSIIENSMVIN